MSVQEHENALKNVIDKAAKQLDYEDWEAFLETATEYLEDKDNELALSDGDNSLD